MFWNQNIWLKFAFIKSTICAYEMHSSDGSSHECCQLLASALGHLWYFNLHESIEVVAAPNLAASSKAALWPLLTPGAWSTSSINTFSCIFRLWFKLALTASWQANSLAQSLSESRALMASKAGSRNWTGKADSSLFWDRLYRLRGRDLWWENLFRLWGLVPPTQLAHRCFALVKRLLPCGR